jgi:phenolic acid decarboxylase
MINAVKEGINYVLRNIPDLVIKYAYEKTYPQYVRKVNTTIQEFILTKIVNGIVINDYDILGVVEEVIPLANLQSEYLEIEGELNNNTLRPIVVYIPRKYTQGRRITSVSNTLAMTNFSPYEAGGLFGSSNLPCNTSALTIGAANIVRKSVGELNMGALNTRVELIGPNAVLIEGINNITLNQAITCTFSGDECLSHLRGTGILIFRELCLEAAKGYIWRKCIVELDEGEIKQGVNIGTLKNIIEEYRDSFEIYNSMLKEKFIRVAFMNDTNKQRRWNDMLGTVFNT